MTTEFFSEPHQLPYDESNINKLTVVLDLDETMGYFRNEDVLIERPNIKETLEQLYNSGIEIICWTASTDLYARRHLSYVDPNGYIKYCITYGNWFLNNDQSKNLYFINRYKCILIDNSPIAVFKSRYTSIVVSSFNGSDQNTPFPEKLTNLLIDLHKSNDSVYSFLQNLEENNTIHKSQLICFCIIMDYYYFPDTV